jgi:hypothetical protein
VHFEIQLSAMNPPQVHLRGTAGCRSGQSLFLAEFWILISAWCSLSGWLLSAVGCLNLPGCFVSFIVGGVSIWFWMKQKTESSPSSSAHWKVRLHRFRRPLPFVFLLTAVLVLIGGALYAPNNYDALSYRLPRIFNWLAEDRWHWIDTVDQRMNYSGTGYEWLMLPLFVFTRSDRLLFLISFLPWLLMPALSFKMLTGLGICPRVAWYWMWLLPMGHCFVMQAGGIGNDSYAATYLLVAVCFALRARKTRAVGDLWIAALAAALLTGAKASNLPLLLPVAIAVWPSWRLLARSIAGTLCGALACVAVSFLPIAVMNQLHAGKWTGDPKNTYGMELKNPVAALAGNAIQLAVGNFLPPVLPSVSSWNKRADHLLKTPFFQKLERDFPRFAIEARELSNEEGAGAGIGLGFLFLIALAGAFFRQKKNGAPTTSGARLGFWIVAGAWIALGVYMAKIGSESGPRLIAPYYPPCMALVLFSPASGMFVRKSWWRCAAILAALSILPVVILTPSRPLLPATEITARLSESHPENAMLARMAAVYSSYVRRTDVFAPLTCRIPAGEQVIGYIGSSDVPFASLWRPYGKRRVLEVFQKNEAPLLELHTHLFAVVSANGIFQRYGEQVDDWLRERNARVVASEKIVVRTSLKNPDEWLMIELKKQAAGL